MLAVAFGLQPAERPKPRCTDDRILARILSFADHETLLRVRLVHSDFKADADAELGRHLVVRSPTDPSGVLDVTSALHGRVPSLHQFTLLRGPHDLTSIPSLAQARSVEIIGPLIHSTPHFHFYALKTLLHSIPHANVSAKAALLSRPGASECHHFAFRRAPDERRTALLEMWFCGPTCLQWQFPLAQHLLTGSKSIVCVLRKTFQNLAPHVGCQSSRLDASGLYAGLLLEFLAWRERRTFVIIVDLCLVLGIPDVHGEAWHASILRRDSSAPNPEEREEDPQRCWDIVNPDILLLTGEEYAAAIAEGFDLPPIAI